MRKIIGQFGAAVRRGVMTWMAAPIFTVLATAIAAPAQTFTTLLSFDNTDGENPSSVIQATDGNLYGTTLLGGAHGDGTIFKITPSGTLTTLYNFCSQSRCVDGQQPSAGLVQATSGNFYGTTKLGGTNCIGAGGCGTVFKITPGGTLTTLYSFCPQSGCVDGLGPEAALIQASDGNFYGTTGFGGGNDTCFEGCGTVFKITPSGTVTTLHRFCSESGCADGGTPQAALVQGTDGNFYGTTLGYFAGGFGTVFKITPSGTLTTLHSFCSQRGCPDGGYPEDALVQATDGNFYGTTLGYLSGLTGTIFKITPSGALTTLLTFDGTDGQEPAAGLVQGTDGNFYGTTFGGGANGRGTAFKITPRGTLTTLYNFCSENLCADGEGPGALAQDTNGTFYGTTASGGHSGACPPEACGTVFSVAVGLGPFVETQPTSGKVGSTVNILGNNLEFATGVAFNGTPATFKVVSSSLISTTVPTGATTGTVQVTLRNGTLTSNMPFRMVP